MRQQLGLASGLLALGAVVHLLPEYVAAAGVGTHSALAYIAYGLEAAAAWCIVAVACAGRPAFPVALWLAFESFSRGLCRGMLPLDRRPAGDVTMCTAAFGSDIPAVLGLVMATACAYYVWRKTDAGAK